MCCFPSLQHFYEKGKSCFSIPWICCILTPLLFIWTQDIKSFEQRRCDVYYSISLPACKINCTARHQDWAKTMWCVLERFLDVLASLELALSLLDSVRHVFRERDILTDIAFCQQINKSTHLQIYWLKDKKTKRQKDKKTKWQKGKKTKRQRDKMAKGQNDKYPKKSAAMRCCGPRIISHKICWSLCNISRNLQQWDMLILM